MNVRYLKLVGVQDAWPGNDDDGHITDNGK